MHVRNNLKYSSISCVQCQCLINQRDYENEQNKLKTETPLKTTTTGIIQAIPYHASMWTRKKNTQMDIWEQRLNHTISFTIVKGLSQVYLSSYDLGKKFHITVLVQIWLKESAHCKKNPRFCIWHAYSYYINLIFHLVEIRYKEKNCF